MYANETPKPLSEEEEKIYLTKASEGDHEAKNKLIEHNLRLVFYIANKFKGGVLDLDDLYSIGTIGLIKAVNTFNPHKNVKFATYSSRCIENEILMNFRQNKKRKHDISIDQSLHTDKEGKDITVSETLGSEKDNVEEEIEKKFNIKIIRDIVGKLPEMEKKIIQYRFGIECKRKNQHDIADLLNISQSYVSRIERKILNKIKREFTKHAI